MEEAEILCDRILIIDRGKIVVEGQPQQIVADFQVKNLEEVFLKVSGRTLGDDE